MPAWIVDFGRWFGGLLVFAMCAAFTSLALVPCWSLFLAVQERASTFWAVMSVPFLYFVWGWSYCLLCVLYKRAVFYTPREGEYPLFSWSSVGWATTGALTNWGCELGDMSVLAAGSIMKKGSSVPANEIWGGTPPRLIRVRGEKDVQDDGVKA